MQGQQMGQGMMGQQGQMGPGMMRGRMRGANIYNPQTETTISGTVQEVSHYICGPWAGTYTILSTPQGPVNAQLGPSEYLQQQNLRIQPGDQIQVTGSQLNIDGIEVLLARSVTGAGQTVALRNQQGMPMWAGTMGYGRRMPRTDIDQDTQQQQYRQQQNQQYQQPQQ